ncbi:MAG: hypothetical protein IJO22_06075 [Oscillospiraceae bacterium]|nr:hypothetical protein [Oscillospiraceae bacterium]
MKEEKFTKILGEIDEKYINEVILETKPRRILPFKKWAAIAACICLILSFSTVVIAEIIGIKFLGNSEDVIKPIYGREYTSYNYRLETEKVVYLPEDAFGERFCELEERLSRVTDFYSGCSECLKNAPDSCEHHKVYGYYRTVFYDGPEEAADLIGYEGLIVPNLPYEYISTHLVAHGNKVEPFIYHINLSSGYVADGIQISIISEMILENPGVLHDSYSSGFGFHVPIKSEDRYITLENGEQCLMVKTVAANSEDTLLKSYLLDDPTTFSFVYHGFIMKDGVFYVIEIMGNKGDENRAEEIFIETANLFC